MRDKYIKIETVTFKQMALFQVNLVDR